MADVFLSYARPNASTAARAARVLERSGYSVWYDTELPAHRAYSDVIERELEDAKSVVVLWSEAAIGSQWVRSEANRARELGKLVQGRLDNSRLPLPFDQIQCADLQDWHRGRPPPAWSQILTSVAALVRGDVGSSPPTRLAKVRRTRRELLVGATAAAGLGGSAGWWLLHRHPQGVPGAAAALLGQAKIAEWQITHEGQSQAIGLYQKVVQDYPRYADGWGYLSIAYAWTSHYRNTAEAASLRERARSAAQQALAIDGNNPIGNAGLAMALPLLGNWKTVNDGLRRAVARRPNLDDLAFHLAMFLLFTGRAHEALKYENLVLPSGPTPAVYFYQALMLWSAGQAEALDDRLTEARRLYPTHFALWFTRFYTTMFAGRTDEALALAADRTNWPTGLEQAEVQSLVRVAEAIHSRSSMAADQVVKEWMARAHEATGYAENAAQFMAAVGRIDDAFTVLRAYFFSEGFDCGEVRFKAQGTYTPHNDRLTHFLFFPSLAPLRSDRRFAKLMNDLQFTRYWETARAWPDYLRTAVH